MLRPLKLRPLKAKPPEIVPPLVRPLVEAAYAGEDLLPLLRSVARSFGFDHFEHGVSLSTHPNAQTHSFMLTTLPREWITLYDEHARIEDDPRVAFGIQSTLPFVWDQKSLRGKSTAVDEFRASAATFGVCSGVSVSIRDAHSRLALTSLTSNRRSLSHADRERIATRLGDFIVLGKYLHELVAMAILEEQIPPIARGAPLSKRERQCLAMAANGLTSGEIAVKLGISERTADFHFCNVLTKLNVMSRQEAVARAIAQGIIHLES